MPIKSWKKELEKRKNNGVPTGSYLKYAQGRTPISNLIKSGSKAIKPLDMTVIDEELIQGPDSHRFKFNPSKV